MKHESDSQEPPLDAAAVTELLRAIADAGWDEAHLVAEGTTLVYSRSSAVPTLGTAAAPPEGASAAAARPPDARQDITSASGTQAATKAATSGAALPTDRDEAVTVDGEVVTAPSLGLFWRSPQPGAPPFVEVGDEVEPDTTVCIVEVMKLMNHVKAGTAGRVAAIHPANGDMVEYGTPLVTIEPS